MKLIVVDDESDVFKLYELFLRSEIDSGQLELHPFESAKECLEFLRSNKVDKSYVVFTDINMPGMGGYGLLSEIKAQWDFVDVYMVSAYSDQDYHRRADELGAEKLISKPVDFEYIKDIVIRYL